MSEPEGRGADWTDAPKGRGNGEAGGAPEAHSKQSTSDEGRRRSEGEWGGGRGLAGERETAQ